MTESPFATHRAVLVDSDYAAAGFLQSFAMAMYAGAAFPMDAHGLRNLDDQHMQIFQDMAASYRRHGEADPDFVDVCKAIKAKRAAHALRVKGMLDELLDSDPDQYEGGRHEHARTVSVYEREHQLNIERRWYVPS
ncbi:hypothetical protein AYO08_10295 [Pseudomonas putida]|uniref:hypothetical protein n=1 Tax=Pseudomonas TaxID=286 RepID=UPI0007DC0EE4|nr:MULTISPECIES: hypothetical protein [Pseudomonas]OAS07715.1 hypothetical protein AYO08_10295 [Pseudomonas putida]OOV92654.1 hypothetical protein MF6396_25325 [Pseudomonas sp. MF6396]